MAAAAARKTVTPLKTKTVHLPDGSTVVLNTSSRLDDTKPREVTLIGEGYFDIQKAPGQPFLVHTGKLTTRVLGTTFNIRAYPGDKSIQITVTKGRVQVMNANRKHLGTLGEPTSKSSTSWGRRRHASRRLTRNG